MTQITEWKRREGGGGEGKMGEEKLRGICTKTEAGGYARSDSWTCLGALLFGSTPSLL